MRIIDLGLMPYADAWNCQHCFFDEMVERKKRGESAGENLLLLVEHPSVVTLGKHAKRENVLLPRDMLKERGIEVYEIERGGDVTYHAPGQLVAYPILDLENFGVGVKDYVWKLEEAVIRTIAHFGVKGERVDGASGVWIGKGTMNERKICALGVKCSRFCTMHGLALNVNTDTDGFRIINPCGFVDKGVTTLALETGREWDMDTVKAIFIKEFNALFQPRILSQGKL